MKYFFLISLMFSYMIKAQEETAPKAKKIAKELTIHNHTRIDNYYWMNKRNSKDVLKYINEENKVSASYFEKNKTIINQLVDEFNQRINPNEIYPPYQRNGVIFQDSYSEGEDYIKTHIIENGGKKLFLDENARAQKKPYYELGNWVPSPNNEYVAICEDFVGRRNYTIRFREFSSEQFLKDKLEATDGSLEWSNDNKTVYYIKKDPKTLRSYQVYKHTIGEKQSKDELIFEEKDELFDVGIEKSNNKQYIIIYSSSTTTTEAILIDANNPNAHLQVFLPREQGHEYEIEVHNDGFYILSNKNAPNKKIVFSKNIPGNIEECKTILEHNSETMLEGISITHKYLLSQERSNGLTQIRIYNIENQQSKYISTEEETYTLGLMGIDDYYTENFKYVYNSMTTPTTVYQQNFLTGEKNLIYQHELLDNNFKSSDYESKRIWSTANDGTKIPISLVYKKGIDLKSAPCLLYGYGSYGYSLPDVFSATRLSLLDRGFVYAQAHIRGENYLGEQWYQEGKFLSKKNTFTDFINAAEHLGKMGYCNPKKLYIKGGSAGGLLMGAVMNMAPHLFKAVVAEVPFVDVVTTMLDESIPLTVGEFEEWGNPKNEEYYHYMLSYSPYDNVQKMNYPHLLITTGYHDSQVQYWEPLKWIAKLREYRTNDNLLLLECNMDAGHGGGSGRSIERLELAKVYSFILTLENEK